MLTDKQIVRRTDRMKDSLVCMKLQIMSNKVILFLCEVRKKDLISIQYALCGGEKVEIEWKRKHKKMKKRSQLRAK